MIPLGVNLAVAASFITQFALNVSVCPAVAYGHGLLVLPGTYLSIELLSAMVLVPGKPAAEMTNRYEERSRLSGVRMICSQLGGFLAVSVPGVIMQFTGKDNPFTYTLTGLIFSCVFCIAVFITVYHRKRKICNSHPRLKWINSAAAD